VKQEERRRSCRRGDVPPRPLNCFSGSPGVITMTPKPLGLAGQAIPDDRSASQEPAWTATPASCGCASSTCHGAVST